MTAKIENISGCARTIDIELSPDEVKQEFDRVYADIRKVARVAGFRPGHAPRDLLEIHYGKRAQEELIKGAIPEYYLKALRQEKLAPIAPPEIENVRFKNHTLSFSAKIDVKPQVKLKGNYRNLKLTRKKIEIEQGRIDRTLENLRESRTKEKTRPDLNDAFAKDLGFPTLDELKQTIKKSLQANAERQLKAHLEGQLLARLLKTASLDIPESLVRSQRQQLLQQLKLNHSLQGEKKEALESKEKELEAEAGKEALRRVKLSFILEKIAQLENIQVEEKDLNQKITGISQAYPGKTEEEIREYLDRENIIPELKAELRDRKTMEFLLREARVEEEK